MLRPRVINTSQKIKRRTHVIKIGVEGDKIMLGPRPDIVVCRGDKIEWQCEFPYAIHLGSNSPLNRMAYSSEKEANGKIRDFVMEEMPYGSYKYSIAVYNGKKVIIEDPFIIVRPEPLPPAPPSEDDD
jgi:hypothetical protein